MASAEGSRCEGQCREGWMNAWRATRPALSQQGEPQERSLGWRKRSSPNPHPAQVRQGCHAADRSWSGHNRDGRKFQRGPRGARSRNADAIWRLDHGQRQFRVRPSQPHDHPALKDGAVTVAQCVTIIRLSDGRRWVFARQSISFLDFIDSDFHARERLAAGARAAFRLLGGGS